MKFTVFYFKENSSGRTLELSVLFLVAQESTCQCRRFRFDPYVRKILWRRKRKPTPIFLPGKSMDRGPWQATVCGVAKESDETQRLSSNGSNNNIPWKENLLAMAPERQISPWMISCLRGWAAGWWWRSLLGMCSLRWKPYPMNRLGRKQWQCWPFQYPVMAAEPLYAHLLRCTTGT